MPQKESQPNKSQRELKTSLPQRPGLTVEITTLGELYRFMWSNSIVLFLMLCIALVVFGNVLNGQFLTADDIPGIIQDPRTQSLELSLKSLSLFRLHISGVYHLFGFNSVAYHATSLLLHVICAFLLFTFTAVLTKDSKISLGAGLLFLVHPMVSETVMWIYAAAYLYYFIEIIGILTAFVLYRRSNKVWYLALAYGIYTLALVFEKSAWLYTIPLQIIVLDTFLVSQQQRHKQLKLLISKAMVYIPFAAIAAVFVATRLLGLYEQRVYSLETEFGLEIDTATPVINRLPYIFFKYIVLLIFPLKLSLFHEGEAISPGFYNSMVLTTIAFGIFYYVLATKKTFVFGLLSMIIVSILPSFSPIVVAWFVAERYMYFGTGLFCIIIAFIIKILSKEKEKLYLGILLLVVATYSLRTAFRTEDFKSSQNIWEATQKTAPFSYRVYNNLGDVYTTQKDYAKAVENFKIALKINPKYADASYNLALTYYNAGDYENAKVYFEKALTLNPNLTTANTYLQDINSKAATKNPLK